MEMTFLVAAEAAVETVARASVVIVMIAAHAIVTVTAIVAHVNRVNHVSRVKTDLLKSLSKMNSRANFVLN
jgi:glycerol-3-phosphate responsive antiterminator